MQSIVILALLGCIAAVSALTLVNPKGDRSGDIALIGGDVKNNKKNQRGITTSYSYEKHVSKTTTNDDGQVVGHQSDNDVYSSTDSSDIDSQERNHLQLGDVLHYNFKQDYKKINPMYRSSDWRWARSSTNDEFVSNYGTFLRDAKSNSIDLISIPYKGYVQPDDSRVTPIADNWQAVLVNKQNITVEDGQALKVHVKFTCTTFNDDQHPLTLSRKSISHPEDDPTLAACGFSLNSYDDSALVFGIVATNKGIWATYQRNPFQLYNRPDHHQRKFSAFKRIGSRSSSYEVVDAAIKYDRSQGKVYYTLNGEIVHTLGDLGTLNQVIRENPAYGDVYTQDRPDLVRSQPKDFVVTIGLTQFLDTIDPNNPSNPPLHTVRLTTDPKYYDPKARFEDEIGIQQNVNWGQGATMTLIEAEIKLKESHSERSGRRIQGQPPKRKTPKVEGEDEEEQVTDPDNNTSSEDTN